MPAILLLAPHLFGRCGVSVEMCRHFDTKTEIKIIYFVPLCLILLICLIVLRPGKSLSSENVLSFEFSASFISRRISYLHFTSRACVIAGLRQYRLIVATNKSGSKFSENACRYFLFSLPGYKIK